MKNTKFIFVLLVIIVLLSLSSATTAFYYTYKFNELSETPSNVDIQELITSKDDVESLQKLSLFLHSEVVRGDEDYTKLLENIGGVLLGISALCLIALISFYRDSVSNKSLNLTGAKDAPPS